MDCVGCDKCRLWGKLQVCVLFSVLKLLLTLSFSTEKLKVFIKMSSLFIELEIKSVVFVLLMKKINSKLCVLSLCVRMFSLLLYVNNFGFIVSVSVGTI